MSLRNREYTDEQRASYDRVARSTTFVLLILLMGAVGALAMQAVQIREMRAVDCAALEERESRVLLYDRLIEQWSMSGSLTTGERERIVGAYTAQREAVAKAAMIGRDAVDC